jgi:hypothetical protein
MILLDRLDVGWVDIEVEEEDMGMRFRVGRCAEWGDLPKVRKRCGKGSGDFQEITAAKAGRKVRQSLSLYGAWACICWNLGTERGARHLGHLALHSLDRGHKAQYASSRIRVE